MLKKALILFTIFIALIVVGCSNGEKSDTSTTVAKADIILVVEEEKENFTYIVDRKLETIGEWDREQLKTEQHLLSDIVTTVERLKFENEPLESTLSEVFSNPKLKRYLKPLTEEEQKQLLSEAESYLLTALIKERDE